MSNEEANSLYKCTVREYHALHKWDAGGTPSQTMELQEMDVDGQVGGETGGSVADRIFFTKYPMCFLLLVWTQTWQVKSPPSGVTDSNFPHIPPRKTVVTFRS
jgi:hypothetical protein